MGAAAGAADEDRVLAGGSAMCHWPSSGLKQMFIHHHTTGTGPAPWSQWSPAQHAHSVRSRTAASRSRARAGLVAPLIMWMLHFKRC